MAEGKTAAADKSRCCRHDGRKVYCKVAWSISSTPSSNNRVEWHEKTLVWWRNTYSPLAKECLLRSYCHHEFGVVGAGRQPSMQCQEWASDGTSFQEVATKTEYMPSPRNVASIHHTNNMLTWGAMVRCAVYYKHRTIMVWYLNPQDFLSWRVKKETTGTTARTLHIVPCTAYPISSRIRTTTNSSAGKIKMIQIGNAVTPYLHPKRLRFGSRSARRLPWGFRCLPQSLQIPGPYLKTGDESFLPGSFQFITTLFDAI